MIERLSGSAPVLPVEPLSGGSATKEASGSFADAFRNAFQEVEASRATSTQAAERFIAGEQVDIHSAALATQRAALQFEYFLQMRNKLVSAYQEIMRIQL